MIEVQPVSAKFKAIAALTLMGGMVFHPPALAQSAPPSEFATFTLFKGAESVDLNPDAMQRLADAIRNAQTPDGCPLGQLKVRVAKGDDLFQKALVAARRDAVLGRLQQMGVPVAGRLFVETEIFGGPEGHDSAYGVWRDRAPPTLATTSTPPKGSKVQPGQRIVVRMAARDDADRGQTGVKAIQLLADSEGGRFVASENYEPCSEPKEKRVEATYTVPADPPPIVRLAALAEDHAGHMSEIDRAEFPTGDFYGTFTMWNPTQESQQTRARADIVLRHDGRGNLTGTMVGTQELIAGSRGNCSFRTNQPNRFRISLVGSYTEGRPLRIAMKDVEESKLIVGVLCEATPPQEYDASIKTYVHYASPPWLGPESPFGEGELLADGSRRYKLDTGTATWTIVLNRVRN